MTDIPSMVYGLEIALLWAFLTIVVLGSWR